MKTFSEKIKQSGPLRKFGDKIYGKVHPRSPEKKFWQKLRQNPNFGVIFQIQWAKFAELPHIILETSGAPTKISEANLGTKPPPHLICKYPPGSQVKK